MATPQGANSLTAFSQRYLFKDGISDLVYGSNPLFQRWNSGRRKTISGGYQWEVPLIHRKFGIGGSFQGWDQNDVSPQDTAITAAWDPKQSYTAVSIDKGTLRKANSPEGTYDLLKVQFDQAKMDLGDKLGTQLQSDGTNAKDLDGMKLAIDDGGVATNYAGVSRTTYTSWRATEDASTSALTEAALQSNILTVTQGGQSPTILYSRTDNYARMLALGDTYVQLPVGSGGADEVLFTSGHTGVLVLNTPYMIESHTFDGANSSNSAIVGINERWVDLGVMNGAEFTMSPFESAVINGQLGYTCMIDFMGAVMVRNPNLCFKMTALTS